MKDQKKLALVVGTRLASWTEPTIVFKAFEERIEREPSVMVWSYEADGYDVKVKIDFMDEVAGLEMQVRINNISDLQSCLETLDRFLINKQSRS